MVRKDDNLPTLPWGMLMVRNRLNNCVHHPCNESHSCHHSHHGKKPYCLSRRQQQLSCYHTKRNLDFNRKWGCCKKFLSLVFMLPTGSRDWKNHSRCKGVGRRKLSQACGCRRLWVKQVVLLAHTGCLLQENLGKVARNLLMSCPMITQTCTRVQVPLPALAFSGLKPWWRWAQTVQGRGTHLLPPVPLCLLPKLLWCSSLAAFWPTVHSLCNPHLKEHCYIQPWMDTLGKQ